jgi:glutathione synthase/RimK-type ligase-like ATP-grasp enzyme
MKITIAFFVRNLDAEKYPFSVRDLYYYSYQEYLLALKRAGAEVYFVTGNDSYLGDGRFSRAWTINAVSEVKDFQSVGEIKADVVFEKGGFEGTDVLVVNDPRLRPMLENKLVMYEQFGEYQPKSMICHNEAEVHAAIEAIPGEMVVVKNPTGNGGKRVYIAKKAEMKVPEDETYPLLVQEFLDMSEGTPGLAKGVHDLRLLMAGGEVIGATLREPEAGKLYANVSQGAAERLVARSDIPAEVRVLARKIDARLVEGLSADLPRYYAIDFARGKQGWRLVELNSKPGLFREANGPLARQFMNSFAQYLVTACEKYTVAAAAGHER